MQYIYFVLVKNGDTTRIITIHKCLHLLCKYRVQMLSAPLNKGVKPIKPHCLLAGTDSLLLAVQAYCRI